MTFVIQLLISVSSIFVSYIFGTKSSTNSWKRDRKKERYYSFYAPYIRFIYESELIFETYISEISLSFYDELVKLTLDNFQYLDNQSLKYIAPLLKGYTNLNKDRRRKIQ